MSGSSLLTRAADATSDVAPRPTDEIQEAPSGAVDLPPVRGISARHNPPARRVVRPEAAAEPADGRLAEALPEGPRPAPRERRWWRLLLGGAR
jgi:hypothetical protein